MMNLHNTNIEQNNLLLHIIINHNNKKYFTVKNKSTTKNVPHKFIAYCLLIYLLKK